MSDPLEVMKPKQREAIFGDGAGSFFAQLTTLAAALCLLFVVLVAGVFVKREAHAFLWGEPQQTRPALQPGESTVINGVTIKRID
jgi:hypothetical protein